MGEFGEEPYHLDGQRMLPSTGNREVERDVFAAYGMVPKAVIRCVLLNPR